MSHEPLRDSKSGLLEAAQAAIIDQNEKAAERTVSRYSAPQRRRLSVFGIIALSGLVLLVLQPQWLAGPAAARPDPPPVAAAGLRVAMIRQRQLVNDFAIRNGHLPASLAEAGDTIPGVSYTRQGDSAFTLTGFAGDSVVTLQSGDSQAAFLGNSLKVLKNRGAP